MKHTLIIWLVLFQIVGFSQSNNTLKLRGFVDSYHAVQVKEPNDILASRSRFRGEIQMVNGKSYFFASVNAVHNYALPELSEIQFREAYLEYTDSNWGFKVGRQIIIWGKADGLKITDVISPMDLTEFLAQDYDDIRMPVNGIVVSRFGSNWDLDLVCVPVFEAYILPGQDNPWNTINQGNNEKLVVEEAVTPELSLKNVEYGAKLSFYYSGVDFELSALRSWNKAPVYSYQYNDSTSVTRITPEHHRLNFAGFGISKSLNAFVIRAESAFYFGKKFSPNVNDYQLGLIERNSINYLVGIDWYPGYEWTITGQFSDEFVLDYSNRMQRPEHLYVSTLGISKKLIRSTLSLSTFSYFDLTEKGIFNRTSADYGLTDHIHVMAGFDWFTGDSGIFGTYNDNSQIWIKAKYNF